MHALEVVPLYLSPEEHLLVFSFLLSDAFLYSFQALPFCLYLPQLCIVVALKVLQLNSSLSDLCELPLGLEADSCLFFSLFCVQLLT